MTVLTKEDIVGVSDLEIETIDVPEWNGSVRIRVLDGAEADRYSVMVTNKQLTDFRVKFVALVLCDENGKRLFSDGEIRALGRKSAKALDRIFEAGLKLNGMNEKGVADLEKNSDVPSDGSGSD